MQEQNEWPIAVIGAGLSGIACAQALREAGKNVVILEKSRSYGGRCATRKFAGSIVDHGAQYFTMRDPTFASAVRKVAGDQVWELSSPIRKADGSLWDGNHDPRFYHREGQNRLARALAGDLDVRREHTVTKLENQGESGWKIHLAEQEPLLCQAVVLTAPWPQTARLLGEENRPETLFQPCLTGLFSFAGTPEGASCDCYALLGDPESVLAWSACENHKTGRVNADRTVLVVQAGPSFSQHWLEENPERWLQEMQEALVAAWGLSGRTCLERFGHRWRFARNRQPLPPIALPPGLFLAGDTCTKSRVESAWLSGAETARQVLTGV
jgi:renalase